MKTRKFARGEDVEGTDEGSADVSSASASDDSYTPSAAKAEPKTRGEAFRAARAAGDKTFEFEGKKYTTELAKPKATPAKEEAPAKRPGIMQRMRDKDTAMVKSAQSKTRQSNADLGVGNAAAEKRVTENRMSPAYGQGRVNPDTMLAMKKGGSVKRYADGGDVAEYDERISKERDKVDRNNKLVNPYLREDANAANKRIETNVSDLRKKRQEAAGVGAGRGEKNPPKAFAAGGSVSSRADGCAQRGKTRGKMV